MLTNELEMLTNELEMLTNEFEMLNLNWASHEPID